MPGPGDPDTLLGELERGQYKDDFEVEDDLCPVDHWEIIESDWQGTAYAQDAQPRT